MKSLSLAETLLPQPASFQKKKNYEIHEVLGEGTFGKVTVRRAALFGASFCPYVHRAWAQLEHSGLKYKYCAVEPAHPAF